MKFFLVASYSASGILVLLCGFFYAIFWPWAILALSACILYFALSLTVETRPIADAAKIASWCWHGIALLTTAGVLLAYQLLGSVAFLLAAFIIIGLTILATLAIVSVFQKIRTG